MRLCCLGLGLNGPGAGIGLELAWGGMGWVMPRASWQSRGARVDFGATRISEQPRVGRSILLSAGSDRQLNATAVAK